MIHLDTNYLIHSGDRFSPVGPVIKRWLLAGEEFATSAVAWAQFRNGPATPQQFYEAEVLLQGRILPFDRAEAELSAVLFNDSGRRRSSQPDCFIAATAILASAPLASLDRQDFLRFAGAGLRLA